MSHVLIQNRTELQIWGMRLLGLSDKTNEQIGRFGTGLKESIAMLLRQGIAPVFFSGTCRIDFKIMNEDGQDEICFRLSERQGRFASRKWHGLGIHPNFGKHDWNDPWMVFRELICNAIDASGVDDLHHTITSDPPMGVAGSTRVFIPVNNSVIRAYAEIGDRLLMLNPVEPMYTHADHGSILPKREKGQAQIYHRGVWVQETVEDHSSLFDYELREIRLTESRSADWYNVRIVMASLLAHAPVSITSRVLEAILKKGMRCYEETVLRQVSWATDVETGVNWRESFHALFGTNAVLTRNEKIYVEKLLAKKMQPVICENTDLYSILVRSGVSDAINALTAEDKDPSSYSLPSSHTQSRFDEIWQAFVEMELTTSRSKPKLMVFRDDISSGRLGFYQQGTCYVSERIVGCEEERIVHIEEICHHLCGYNDETREFQTFLLSIIGKLL